MNLGDREWLNFGIPCWMVKRIWHHLEMWCPSRYTVFLLTSDIGGRRPTGAWSQFIFLRNGAYTTCGGSTLTLLIRLAALGKLSIPLCWPPLTPGNTCKRPRGVWSEETVTTYAVFSQVSPLIRWWDSMHCLHAPWGASLENTHAEERKSQVKSARCHSKAGCQRNGL